MNDSNIYQAFVFAAENEQPNLYGLHCAYRLTYPEAREAVMYLSEIGVVDFDGKNFPMVQCLSKKQLSLLYRKFHGRKCVLEESLIDLYKKRSIKLNSMYLPDLDRLDQVLGID